MKGGTTTVSDHLASGARRRTKELYCALLLDISLLKLRIMTRILVPKDRSRWEQQNGVNFHTSKSIINTNASLGVDCVQKDWHGRWLQSPAAPAAIVLQWEKKSWKRKKKKNIFLYFLCCCRHLTEVGLFLTRNRRCQVGWRGVIDVIINNFMSINYIIIISEEEKSLNYMKKVWRHMVTFESSLERRGERNV